MKKNYITPNTEMTTWASMGLMNPEIAFGVNSVSGGGTEIKSTSEMNLID
jgi:hypothetical protein